MNIRISVVIPAYNSVKYIERAINSVLVQQYPAYEIIIVDDGSVDDTARVVSQISSPVIKYYYQNNAGPSSARNNGILKSTGDYVAFLDADDVWYSNHLSDATTLFTEHPDICWFSSAFDITINNNTKTRSINKNKSSVDYFRNSLRSNFIHTSSVVIKRDVFNWVGWFNENWTFGEDLNMWIRIALTHPLIGYNRIPGSVFNRTTGSLTYNKRNYDLKNTLRVLYFTDKVVEAAGNKQAAKLLDHWIEDAVYSSIAGRNLLVLRYIQGRWRRRIGLITGMVLLTYHICPLKFILLLNYLNKVLRK